MGEALKATKSSWFEVKLVDGFIVKVFSKNKEYAADAACGEASSLSFFFVVFFHEKYHGVIKNVDPADGNFVDLLFLN